MSLQDLHQLSGIPGLDLPIQLLITIRTTVENVKIHRERCKDIATRCVSMMPMLQDSPSGLGGQSGTELTDDITVVIQVMHRRINEWSSLSPLKSYIYRHNIEHTIDKLGQDIDGIKTKFNIPFNLGTTNAQLDPETKRRNDREELQDLLQAIVKSTEDMETLLNLPDANPLDGIMEMLQVELQDPDLQSTKGDSFREGLWWLHEKTSRLPPLVNLSGQVKLIKTIAISKGAANDVYLGEWLSREKVALRLPRAVENNPEIQQHFIREVSGWRNLRHPNVVPLYGIAYLEEELFYVSPWMENGTSTSYIQRFPQADKLKILHEAAAGLEYLHSQNIVHGDLRGANILISEAGSARLSEFGQSKLFEDCGQGVTSVSGINPRWFAPEVVQQTEPLSTHADIWSFGMVCLEIISGQQPYSTISRDISVVRELDQGKTPERPGRHIMQQGLTDELWSLMQKCWQKKPRLRPSMTQVRLKLSSIRGLTASEPTSPKPYRVASLFRRPATADTPTNTKAYFSARLWGLPRKDVPEESDQSSRSSGERRPSSIRTTISTDTSLHEYSSSNSSRTDINPPRIDVPHLSSTRPLPSASSPESPVSPTTIRGPPLNTPFQSTPEVSLSGVTLITSPPPSAALSSALLDTNKAIYLNSSGHVSCGTLQGFIDRLINNFTSRSDLEFRDILLTTCADFVSPRDLFSCLTRRFNEAESATGIQPEERVATQYNIFMTIAYWISCRQFCVDQVLLLQMRDFCQSVISPTRAPTMQDKAVDLLRMIEERLSGDDYRPSIPLAPGRRVPRTSEMSPRDLAIGFTIMEGDLFRCLQPIDYIAHLGKHSGPSNIEASCVANNKIIVWIQQTILLCEKVENRVEAVKFFINTAQECRRFRNFSTMTAITIALCSAHIRRLPLTRRWVPQDLRELLHELDSIVNPTANHRAYRAALTRALDPQYANECIPWIAVHLRELHSVLQQYPQVVTKDNKSLINFERYTKFAERLKELTQLKPTSLERYRSQGQLAYVEAHLRNVHPSSSQDDDFNRQSLKLHEEEAREWRQRKLELKALGFRTP
ncbi:ras GEF [Pluteus cervinus]|uniref:Ras GEF n=1 Tax=Pluteus cervinus TaxID=181527 RepID=A0ACD3B3H0_9AGAR|nr:ras GEF [Pluteus cervinus]